ncbi:tetratricopeptide repeat protein [Candidatus Sumerlaeota bacterium]|nr:tetratricopeptide repeat protein [Candidatus Sumerlaeota bacterium]
MHEPFDSPSDFGLYPDRATPLKILAIIVLTIAAYRPVFNAGFIWDDDKYVTENAALRDAGGLKAIWLDPAATPQYYPLVHTSFWIEYHLWGLNPRGYHAVNILLHAANGILLWLVLRRMRVQAAWFIGIAFALHPVHVESVAWITERKNLLSGIFYLLALWAYIPFARLERAGEMAPPGAPPPARDWKSYGCAFLLYAAAILSKTVACTLPAAILLLIWWRRGRFRPDDLAPLIPMFALGIVMGVATAWLEKHHVGAVGGEWSLTLVDRALIAARAPWFYLAKIFWPARLMFIYPRWSSGTHAAWEYDLPILTLCAVGILMMLRRATGRTPLTALFFFIGTLFPALGFFDIFPFRYSFIADHFQYLASIGPIALGVGLLDEAMRRAQFNRNGPYHHGPLARILSSLFILILVVSVRMQAANYRSEEGLWLDTLRKNPNASIAYNNLGSIYARANDFERAATILGIGLERFPEDIDMIGNRAGALLQLGREEEAESALGLGLNLDPQNPWMLNTLGLLYLHRRQTDQAIDLFRRAQAIHPALADSYNNLAKALAQTGRRAEAAAALREGLAHDPSNKILRANLDALCQPISPPPTGP